MPKIKYPENIQKLKEQLETGNNLVDYFFICGISPSLCTNELLYKLSSEEEKSEELKNILKPTILCKFPEFDKTNDIVDESIISYCFPEGFNISYSSSSYPDKKIFSVILDNNLFSQDYPQKYLTCILFYEKLYQYKKLQQQLEKIESNKEGKDIDNNNENNINNIRSSLKEEKNMNIYRHKKMATSALPSMDLKKCKLLGEQDLKDMNIDKIIDNNNINNNIKENEKNKENPEDKNDPFNKLRHYYIPKCICLVSIHPHIKLYQKILSNICEYGLSQNREIPLEKIITNLIIEVPVPPRGLYSINYNYDFNFNEEKENETQNNNQEIKRIATQCINRKELANREDKIISPLTSTGNNKLLVAETDLNKFNKKLSFNCKMETIKHILLNSKILFFSLNLTTIIDTISAFMSLIFPFKYSFQISSYLHKNNYGILETVSPFIIGINEKYNENFFEVNEITLDAQNFFVVDLDSDSENNYYLFSDEDFPKLPQKLVYNLEKEIKSLENMTKNTNKDVYIINKEKRIKEFNEIYQEKFFNFFCEMLKGYEEYLNRDFFNEDMISIMTLFNCQKFVKSSYHHQNDYPFYTKFVEDSQLFQDFIFKNMIPKNNNELMDILIVNNYYNSQKKKKNKIDEQDEYAIKNKYIVPRPKEITKEEKNKIIQDRLTLCKKGQIIRKLNKNEETEIKFDYYLFPDLDFNIYCNNDNVNQYDQPPDYREEIEALNNDSISKSSLGKNINRAMEMKNYLYLTWLEIWAFTFGNNDIKEKHYRFDQMLDVLDKVIHHEMNILNLMFNMLNQYKEHQMMLKLYQKILYLKLKPSTMIFDIMSQILDKQNMKNLLDEMKKNHKKAKEELKFNDYNKQNNRERTFLSINDDLPLETKPKFYFDYFCVVCNGKINLYLVSKNFEGIKNDTLWVKCDKCGEYILPKITVKFGLNFINKKSNSTSIEEFVLHSPYNLKTNIKDAVNTHIRNETNNEKFKLKISNFKTQFKTLFWDFIWYCLIHDLDYNILLPYSKTLEEEKKSLSYNPNIKIFEVCYDDATFKDNQNKIEKISKNIIKKSEENNKNKKFKKLKQCSGVIKVEIKNKIYIEQNIEINEINEINELNEIKEEREDEKSVDSVDENKDIKKNLISEEEKVLENNNNKIKPLNNFNFLNSLKEKLEEAKKKHNEENN